MPFIMRRNKKEVLHDLPEKIIQDYICDMTEVQQSLYEQFEEMELKQVENDLENMKDGSAVSTTTKSTLDIIKSSNKIEQEPRSIKTPILKLLMNLRKICNHP